MGLVSMSANEEMAPRPGTEGPFKVEATDIVTGRDVFPTSKLEAVTPTPFDQYLIAASKVTDEEIAEFIASRSPKDAVRDLIKALPGYDAVIHAGSKHDDIRYVVERLHELGAPPPKPAQLLHGEAWTVKPEVLNHLRRQIAKMGELLPGVWYALEGMVTVGMLGEHEAVTEDHYKQLNAKASYDALVDERFIWRSADEEARQRLKKRDLIEPPSGVTLTELLAESDEPLQFRIEDIWPAGSRIVTAAQRKAGKTTLSGNISKALIDGGPFLGTYQVQQVCDGTVALLDFEMSRNMLRAWYRDLSIRNTENLYVWPLRGLGRTFDLRDKDTRAQWVEQLQAIEAKVLIIDCLAPIFSALSITENHNEDVGPLLDGIDALLVEAGIEDCMVMHHMGHGAERSRGASRLRDWPEVEWKIVRAVDDKDEAIDNGSRFFSAYGRDVDVEERELTFDREQRMLIVDPVGRSRAEVKASAIDRHAMEAADIVKMAGKPLGVGEIKAKMRSSNNTQQTNAIALAVQNGWLTCEAAGSKKMHSVGPNYPVGQAVQMDWAKTHGS